MSPTPPFERILRLSELAPHLPNSFLVQPDSAARTEITKLLGVAGIRKLRLAGQVTRINDNHWRLEADLGATVTQDCVVTLAPVVTRIDRTVIRIYLAQIPEPHSDEMKMPDDSIEPLLAEFDLGAVLIEELALVLPLYPHSDFAEPFAGRYAPEGTEVPDTAGMSPFSELVKLRSS